jgi:hypothetical protein
MHCGGFSVEKCFPISFYWNKEHENEPFSVYKVYNKDCTGATRGEKAETIRAEGERTKLCELILQEKREKRKRGGGRKNHISGETKYTPNRRTRSKCDEKKLSIYILS